MWLEWIVADNAASSFIKKSGFGPARAIPANPLTLSFGARFMPGVAGSERIAADATGRQLREL
jgi:hypothetical protein